jgi:DNA repair exonuclease SbcCD ATPase subunit
MKILKLSVENAMRIKFAEINANGESVLITGKNESGKSSLLESIIMGITGKMPDKPIKDGEKKAVIKIDTEEFFLKKIITPSGARLEITDSKGEEIKEPQTFLNSIYKNMLDPLRFKKLDSKKQKDLLLEVQGLDFSDMDKKKKEFIDERVIVGREGKKLKSLFDEFSKYENIETPENEISIIDLSNKLNNISDELYEIDKIESNLNVSIDENIRMKNEIDSLKNELAELEIKFENQSEFINKLKNSLCDKNKEYLEKEKEEISQSMQNANSINENIKKKKKFIDIKKENEDKKIEYENLTKKINDIDTDKEYAIKTAKMPIDGLSFDEDGILYNNIPFKQLTDTAEFKVALAMSMALNPEFKVIVIRNGSEFDSDNIKIIEEMAKEKDFQLWIEKVDESGNLGIVIDNGMIANNQIEKVS